MEQRPEKASGTGLPWYAWLILTAGGYFLLRSVGSSLGDLVAQRRGKLWQLYDRNRGLADATPAQLDAVRKRIPEISRMAVELKEAAGTFDDNEDAVYSAFRQLRSRYELLWLNKTFSYSFDNPSSAPQLGAFLDGILSDDEWIPIVRAVEPLPNFAP